MSKKTTSKKIKKSDRQIAIIMGSQSDLSTLEPGLQLLDEMKISYYLEVVSAHRTPERMYDFAANAEDEGVKVIIAAAGGAAHLPGMVASLTTLPVIGVPVESSKLKGLDSLLSIAQMPPGIPVATMAIGNSINAVLFALQILALNDAKIHSSVAKYRQAQNAKVKKMNQNLRTSVGQSRKSATKK